MALQYLRRVRARFERGFSIVSLGPNEARILYDGVASLAAIVVSVGFSLVFFLSSDGITPRSLLLLSPPAFVVVFNRLLGLYTSRRTASGRIKAAMLLISVFSSGVCAWALTRQAALVVLWVLLVYPLLALPRLLLGLPYSKHKGMASVAVNVSGPVLVIGGAGYIGSATVSLLLQRGHKVRVLDKLMYGHDSLQPLAGRFELIEGDVTDISELTLAMKGASTVIHLAGLVGDPACAIDDDFTRHTNIVATRMAKEVAQSLGVHRFIFASSCSVYGVTDIEARETDALNPVSLYAQTKIDSERELLFSGRDDFFVTVLRFATVFGHSPRPRFDLVANLFTAQAMTDRRITVIGPSQWRPFVHVRDLARAIDAVGRADPAIVQNQVFNVGDSRLNMTILQLAETVKAVCSKYVDVEISISDNLQDRRNYSVSFEKIHSFLGFEAETSVEAGIEEIVEHFIKGTYKHYREERYHNDVMTAAALRQFQDPVESLQLYSPLKRG